MAKRQASGRVRRKAVRRADGPEPGRRATGYAAVKERARARNLRLSAEGRDIAPIPPVADPERRAEARNSLRVHCEVYHPDVFYLEWSDDHLTVIARIEECVFKGGFFAMAMPRGDGKTSMCETAIEWATLHGHKRFPGLIGVEATAAQEMLESCKSELENNDLLYADFPEVVHPVRCLEGIPNRCKGQICLGARTQIKWTARYIVLPTLPADVLQELGVGDWHGCGAIIQTTGLLGRVRGMKHKRPDGRSARPDFLVVDDPQTDATARSIQQCKDRIEVLQAISKMGGPDQKLCAVMPCTVIKPGDMADQILDRKLHPEWRGERMKMVYSFPDREDLWLEDYAELYRAGLKEGNTSAATRFYRKHRKAMDRGAVVAWPARHFEDELSALQHAMNWRIQGESSFQAEMQNEPIPADEPEFEVLTADQVAGKLNGYARRLVPAGCDVLTAFIDVQARLLYYMVCAWQKGFTGTVIEYGVYPDQQRRYFSYRGVERTLRRRHRGAGEEGAIYAGLGVLTRELITREWQRDGGGVMALDLCLVDQGYKTDTVHQFCRESAHKSVLLPARGVGITATKVPINEYDRKRGKIGHHWWIPKVKSHRVLRHLEADVNYWKTFVHERLATAMGDTGCLSLWGRKALIHRMAAEHVTAEFRVRTEADGRTVDEWKLPPHQPDNHLFDCLVGCAAGASYRGIVLPGTPPTRGGKRKKVKLSDVQRRKREQRRRAR